MTYTVYQRTHEVGRYDTYAQANKRVLELSGAHRIWDAVDFHMTSTKIQLRRVLVRSNLSIGDIGPRNTAHTSWSSLYHALHSAAWWVPPNQDLCINLLAEFERSYVLSSQLSFSHDPGEHCTLSYSQLYGAFDHVAATHEITTFATDWPQ